MRVRVLGSAADGGVPQWNCGCVNCAAARAGALPRRREECVAVGDDKAGWFLLNAAAEVRAQVESFRPLHARGGRESPIAGVILTSGDLDHCLGLLSLRAGEPLVVYATEQVQRGLMESNVLYRMQLRWRTLTLGEEVAIGGLLVTAVPAPGKVPVHLEGLMPPHPENNVGLLVREGGRALAYFPSVGLPTPNVQVAVDRADCVLFDGTFWSSDELVPFGGQRAAQMAHLPVAATLRALTIVRAERRAFIHVNNTNPILRDGPERAAVERAGWEVAWDGMELDL